MKKVISVLLAVILVVMIMATGVMAGDGQGVPSAKCAASWGGIDYTPTTGDWYNVPGLFTIIKTSEQSELIISVTAECALATDVKIKGTGKEETSTSLAQIEIQALVCTDTDKDGDFTDETWTVAMPGDVCFAYRLMLLKGLLWAPADVDPDDLLGLPEQYIEIYEETRTANAFNFVLKNVGSGVHGVKVQIMTDTAEGFEGADVGAVIGKRTLIVEEVRMVKD